MLTVGETIAQTGLYSGANGTCSQSEAIRYLDLAQDLLWNKSDFQVTTGWYCFNCIDSCVTLPSEIKQIRLAWVCGTPISIGSQWFESIPQVGQLDPRRNCWRKFIQEGNTFATFQEYTEGPYNIRVMAESAQDVGVEVTPHVVDEYGTKAQETIAIALAPESADGQIMCKALIGFVKPKTHGRIRVYAYDPAKNYTLLLAVYQPYDINPSFLRYKMLGCGKQLTVFAKKKYIPVTELTDFVSFPTTALIHAVQAVVYRENRDDNAYLSQLNLAVQEINRETADLEQPTGEPLRNFRTPEVSALTPPFPGYGWGGGWGAGFGGFYP